MNAHSAKAAKRVALLGFGDFERTALVSYLRLSQNRVPAYKEAATLADADFVIADADHAGTIDAVLGADRVADTVFIGSLTPDGALAWMMRPIDPLQVFRELDATVALRTSRAAAAAPSPPARTPGKATPTPSVAVAGPDSQPPAPLPTSPPSPPQPLVDKAARRSAPRRSGDLSAPTSVLLVDSSDAALHALERQLQALGLRTETAPSSQRALELLALQKYDLVFVDVDLGPHSELDGLALCQHLKHSRHPPAAAGAPKVVMVAAQASATDRVRGSFAGCDAYLVKPFDDDVLRRALRQLDVRLPMPGDAPYVNSRPGNLHSQLQAFDPLGAPPTPTRRR
jgi:two-component system cell cycle response regulator